MTLDDLRQSNFIPSEFFKSKTAKSYNIDNTTTDPIILKNLAKTARKCQEIRDYLTQKAGYDCPINIHCAYRSPEVNNRIGGKKNSQHLKGEAVDFDCEKYGNLPAVFFELRNSGIVFDQLLLEKDCIHFSVVENKNRQMIGRYIDGKFTKL